MGKIEELERRKRELLDAVSRGILPAGAVMIEVLRIDAEIEERRRRGDDGEGRN